MSGGPLIKSRMIGSGAEASVGGARRQTSPQQLKEVIQVAHSHVGSVAILVTLTHREVHG